MRHRSLEQADVGEGMPQPNTERLEITGRWVGLKSVRDASQGQLS